MKNIGRKEIAKLTKINKSAHKNIKANIRTNGNETQN